MTEEFSAYKAVRIPNLLILRPHKLHKTHRTTISLRSYCDWTERDCDPLCAKKAGFRIRVMAHHPNRFDSILKLYTWRLPCSRLSRENTLLLTRAFEERARSIHQYPQLAPGPRGRDSCLCRTRYPFVSGRCRPSQVIEFVFTASPETTRSEPREIPSLSRLAAGHGSLRRRGSLFFSSR